MWKLDERQSCIMKATPALINMFARMGQCVTERPLSRGRVDYLKSEYRSGRMTVPIWAYCELDGKECRLNGQHSSNGLLEIMAEDGLTPNVSVVVLKFLVSSKEEALDIFQSFDQKESARNFSDNAAGAISIFAQEWTHQPDTLIWKNICHGIEKVMNLKKTKQGEKAKLAKDHEDLVNFYGSIAGRDAEVSCEFLRKMHIGCAIAFGWNRNKTKTREFFRMLVDADRKVTGIRDYLIKTSGPVSSSRERDRILFKLLDCMKAHFEGEKWNPERCFKPHRLAELQRWFRNESRRVADAA